jgi:hypothetical protein
MMYLVVLSALKQPWMWFGSYSQAWPQLKHCANCSLSPARTVPRLQRGFLPHLDGCCGINGNLHHVFVCFAHRNLSTMLLSSTLQAYIGAIWSGWHYSSRVRPPSITFADFVCCLSIKHQSSGPRRWGTEKHNKMGLLFIARASFESSEKRELAQRYQRSVRFLCDYLSFQGFHGYHFNPC